MNKKSILFGLSLSVGLFATSAMAQVAPPVEAGPDEVVMVKTIPASSGSAHCILSNKAGETNVTLTPMPVDIIKASGTLDIRCMSADGTWVGHMQLKAKMDGSFQSIVNLPFTGLFAANSVLNDFNDPIEASVGSAVKYPKVIEVPMHSTIQRITDAKYAPESEAIANAPEAVSEPTPSPVAPVHKKRHHVIHHVYHTEESHS